MKYVIKNGDYYLTNQYEPAAEAVLGYGGVYGKTNIKEFDNLDDALKELRLIKAKTHNYNAEIVKVETVFIPTRMEVA